MNEAEKALNHRLIELRKMHDEYKQDIRVTQNMMDNVQVQINDVERGLDAIRGNKR